MSRYIGTAREFDRIVRQRGHGWIVGEVAEPALAMAELGWWLECGTGASRYLACRAGLGITLLPDGEDHGAIPVIEPAAVWFHDTSRVVSEWPDATQFHTKSPLRARLSAWCDGSDDEIMRRLLGMGDGRDRRGDVIEALRKENAILASQTNLEPRPALRSGLLQHLQQNAWLLDDTEVALVPSELREILAALGCPVVAGQRPDLIDEDPPKPDPDAMTTIAEQARAVTAVATKDGCRHVAVIGGGSRVKDLAYWALRDAGWVSSPSGGYDLALHRKVTCEIISIVPDSLAGSRFDLFWLVGSEAGLCRAEIQASAGPSCRIFPGL